MYHLAHHVSRSCLTPQQFLIAERLFPGSAMRAVMQKVLLGVCVAPLAISTAFSGVLFFDGRSLADTQVTQGRGRGRATLLRCITVTLVQAKLRRDVIPTWSTGLAYWPLASVVMFRCCCW